MVLSHIILFLVSCFFLFFAGYLLVKTVNIIASFLRFSEFVAGFIIISVVTSVPELFVGITSALAKNTALSLGNVIGANIADLTIVMGIGILLGKGIKIESKKTMNDCLWMVLITAIPLVLMLIGNQLSRIDGIILLTVFVFYIRYLLRERKEFRKELTNKISHWKIVLASIVFILSLFIMFISAQNVVRYAGFISIELGLSVMFIGLILLSFGTTLPETMFNANAILKGYKQMAVGDIVGSVITNSTLVLGVTSIIHPISADMVIFFTSGVFMVITAFLFATFAESRGRLSWKEGVSMIMLYIFFLIVQFYLLSFRG